MAQVPYNDGISTVTPDATAPDDYQHIQTNPAMFGGAIAQGEQDLGQGLSKATQFWGQVQTDDVLNNAQETATGIVKNFKNLQGADALKAKDDTLKQLDDTYDQQRALLNTPEQQYQFDQQSRSFRQRFITPQIYDHATAQAHDFAVNTNQRNYKQALDLVASNATDPDKSEAAIQMALQSAGKNAHLVLGDSASVEDVDAYMRPYLQGAVKTQAESIAVHDPAGALSFIEKNKDRLGTEYAPLADQVRTRASEQKSSVAADQAMGQAVTQSPVSGSYVDKVAGVEGTSQNPASTATGTGQFVDATWKQMVNQYRPDLAANKTPDQILALRSDPALGREMVARYAQQNTTQLQGAGIPATDSNLYLAHFLGGDGAVKALSVPDSTPVAAVVSPAAIQANPSVLANKTVGDLKQWADLKMGGPATMKADAYSTVMARTDLTDQEKQGAIARINQRYTQAEIASQQNAQAIKAQNDQAEGAWVPKILTNATSVKPQDIANDPSLSADGKIKMDSLLRQHLKDTQDGTAATYGSGFYDTLKAVTAPPGDPNRISDPAQVLRMAIPGPNGEPPVLTLSGAEKINGMLKESQSADGSADNKAQAAVLAYAKHQLSFEHDTPYGGKIRDPNGEDQFNIGFTPALLSYWEKQRAAGKTMAEMSDQKTIDGLIAPFKRTAAQLNKDMAAAGENPAAEQPPVSPKTQEEFDALPAGAHFINPADGRLMIKNAQPVPGSQ